MKRILALALALAMVLSLAACKGKDDTTTTTGSGVGAGVDEGTLPLESESESESDLSTEGGTPGNASSTKRPSSTVTVKPSQSQVSPSQKTFDIKVYENEDGEKILSIDGVEYNTRNANDVAAIKELANKESENNLLGQIYNTDPSIAMVLGLSELEEGSALSYKYDSSGAYFYVDDINSWQQNFGFNPLYDFGASFTFMFYDTVRLKFNYMNRGYMLQLWKGQYGLMFIGSEIGFYKKDSGTLEENTSRPELDHFECATDHLLPIEMVCYRVGLDGTISPLFKRKYENHWWSTGFVPGVLNNFANLSELIVEARITFDNALMTQIVADTFKVKGFKQITQAQHSVSNPDTYYVSGNDIIFVWRYIKDSKDVTILAPTTTTTRAAVTTTSNATTGN